MAPSSQPNWSTRLPASLPAALLLLVGLYLTYILFSPSGLPRVVDLENEIHRQEQALHQARAVTEALQQEVDRLASDPNYIAEAARTQLGLLDPMPPAAKTPVRSTPGPGGRRRDVETRRVPTPSADHSETPATGETGAGENTGAAQLDQVFESLAGEGAAQPE